MAEFVSPDFLSGHSVDEVYAAMREVLPSDIDSSEGSHVWNFLRPTALVAAELYEATLPQVIMTIFPEWSAGPFLDAHAKARGMSRYPATAATGEVTVTGAPGLVIAAGVRFSTAGTDAGPAIEYVTTEDATLPAGGSATIPIICTEPGTKGNTGAGTIILVADGNTSITSVTNTSATTGGTDTETDDSLRQRILDYDQDRGTSYVGTYADYVRWAKEADPDVGVVTVTTGSPNVVKLYITDKDGSPASDELLENVHEYIASPGDPYKRLLPINASLWVGKPDDFSVEVYADVLMAEGATLEGIKTAFLASLQTYLAQAMTAGVIRQTQVGAILSGIEGVRDYDNLAINRAGYSPASTIEVSETDLPTISADDITLEALIELL